MPGEGSRTNSWEQYANQRKYDSGRTGQDWGRAILGGPVGWGEVANGKGLLGDNDPFSGTTMNFNMTEDVYNSMSPEEWAHFAKMSNDEQVAFIQQRRQAVMQGGINKAVGQRDPNSPEGQARAKAAKDAEYEAWRKQTLTRLDDFSKKMGMSVDQLIQSGDAGVKAAQMTGERAAAQQALAAGAGPGGLSMLNTQKAAADSMNNYQMQRQGMGLQATQSLMGGLQNQYMNDEDRRRYEQGMNLQLQQAQAAAQQQKYMMGQQQASGLGGLVGTGIGAYFGSPQAGQAIGSQLGASSYQGSNPYKPYQYQYPSGLGGGYNGAQ